jgi:hypothetical protein
MDTYIIVNNEYPSLWQHYRLDAETFQQGWVRGILVVLQLNRPLIQERAGGAAGAPASAIIDNCRDVCLLPT